MFDCAVAFIAGMTFGWGAYYVHVHFTMMPMFFDSVKNDLKSLESKVEKILASLIH